jgi:hypothetical protein
VGCTFIVAKSLHVECGRAELCFADRGISCFGCRCSFKPEPMDAPPEPPQRNGASAGRDDGRDAAGGINTTPAVEARRVQQ